MLDGGRLSVETDQYLRTQNTATGHAEFFLLRAVVGVGHQVEVGVNSGAFDYLHPSESFVDATAKWRPIRAATTGLVLGGDTGLGVRDGASGVVRSLVYASAFVVAPSWRTRVSTGPYCATRNVFAGSGRCGAQVTLQQPVPSVDWLELAADWFSGDGALATVGVIGTVHRLILYAGYGFANSGRVDDLLTLELGFTLF